MIRKIRLAIASLALLNILFTPLGYAEYPRVIYQIQGLNQDLMSLVQHRLDSSLQSLVNPSTQDVQFWYQHSLSDIKQTLEAYGYFKPSINHSLKKIDGDWDAKYQISVGPPLKITTFNISAEDTKPNPKITKLMADFPIHRGDIFNSEAYEDAKQQFGTATVDIPITRTNITITP